MKKLSDKQKKVSQDKQSKKSQTEGYFDLITGKEQNNKSINSGKQNKPSKKSKKKKAKGGPIALQGKNFTSTGKRFQYRLVAAIDVYTENAQSAFDNLNKQLLYMKSIHSFILGVELSTAAELKNGKPEGLKLPAILKFKPKKKVRA